MSNSCKKRVNRSTYLLWVAYRFRVGVNKAVYWLFTTFCLFWDDIIYTSPRFFGIVKVFFKITFKIIFLA